jgi:hypothetical protein
MRKSWGRFTVRGTKKVESLITGQMETVEKRSRRALDTYPVEAVLLLGGYGRGEGGVEIVSGEEKPHNNFDFLIITTSLSKERTVELQNTARQLFDSLARELGIGIDFAISTDRKLAYSPCLVMWYDMRFGHKVIIGPDDYMARYTHFKLENILSSDALALLVNRGTLFVINQVMIEQNPVLTKDLRRVFTKHMIKAIIGYGDSLLYFLGDYNWSYEEKGRRMAKRNDINDEFKAIYLDAIDFRFAPRYSDYEDRDPEQWLADTLALCEDVHMRCERIRLNDETITWEKYLSPFLRRSLSDNFLSPRSWIRKVLNSVKVPSMASAGLSIMDRIGYRAGGPRGILLASFPAVVYPGVSKSVRQVSAQFLQAQSSETKELSEGYLRWWAKAGDSNFLRGLTKMGIEIETEEQKNDLHHRGCASHVVVHR